MTPSDRRYTKSHEWAKLDDDVATIGITDHAQQQLGDLTFVDLPGVEDRLEAGEECIVIESVKAASDVYAPVSGEVVAINDALVEHPEIINEDPYEQGWLIKIRVDASDALDRLLKSCDYESLISDDEA